MNPPDCELGRKGLKKVHPCVSHPNGLPTKRPTECSLPFLQWDVLRRSALQTPRVIIHPLAARTVLELAREADKVVHHCFKNNLAFLRGRQRGVAIDAR